MITLVAILCYIFGYKVKHDTKVRFLN